jgi:hypothetical protein
MTVSRFLMERGYKIASTVKISGFWRRLQEEIYAYELLKLNKNNRKCALDA